MQQKLKKQLTDKYPKIFGDKEKSPQKTLMCFPVECGDGWYALIDNLCRLLQYNTDKNGDPQVVAFQIKEKFGGLRFYVNGASDKQYNYIEFAEMMSYRICEDCGTTNNVTTGGVEWINSLCKECRKNE